MCLGRRKVVRIGNSFRNRIGHEPSSSSAPMPIDRVEHHVRNPELSLHIHGVVWRMEVVSLLHAPSVVEITLVFVVKASRVALRSNWAFKERVSKEQERWW